jgi:DNA-binding CsgD family transcriptional regulator
LAHQLATVQGRHIGTVGHRRRCLSSAERSTIKALGGFFTSLAVSWTIRTDLWFTGAALSTLLARWLVVAPNREVQSMSSHFSKRSVKLPSQISPSAAASVTSDVTLADTYVLLCDWHGQVVWKSGTDDRAGIGEEIWAHASNRSRERLRAALASVVALQMDSMIEVESDRGNHFRFWMWPLKDPAIAVCILALRIPSELARLTNRERDCLRCLAQGMSTRDMAGELKIGLTTVHTHLRRSREKLGLGSVEALIGIAARYFVMLGPSVMNESPTSRKRSV